MYDTLSFSYYIYIYDDSVLLLLLLLRLFLVSGWQYFKVQHTLVKYLILVGYDITPVVPGCTPLHTAAAVNSSSITLLLLVNERQTTAHEKGFI